MRAAMRATGTTILRARQNKKRERRACRPGAPPGRRSLRTGHRRRGPTRHTSSNLLSLVTEGRRRRGVMRAMLRCSHAP